MQAIEVERDRPGVSVEPPKCGSRATDLCRTAKPRWAEVGYWVSGLATIALSTALVAWIMGIDDLETYFGFSGPS
ncbi:MAG: hypothetical protein ACI9OJ_005417 [Myxococcota bacterium]|jgi:hypothetical protein